MSNAYREPTENHELPWIPISTMTCSGGAKAIVYYREDQVRIELDYMSKGKRERVHIDLIPKYAAYISSAVSRAVYEAMK
jgi:hypothetical protein